MKLRVPLLLLAATLTFAACGDDDGGSVTESGDGSESGSASASASASASGSASGSAAAAGECVLVGNTEADADTVVVATLDEWSIEVDEASVPAGVIEFEAENVGEEPHELVIVEGAAPEDLTITEDGLDEDALPEGAEVLGEIEGFPGGETCAGHFDLEPGAYSLVCNIVEESEDEAHATEGMVTAFTVT